MALINPEMLVRFAKDNRCLKCSIISLNNELFCDSCGPSRTTVELTDVHKAAIIDTVRTIREAKDLINQNELALTRIRQWFAGLISKGDKSFEAVLHTYIYIFWSSLKFEYNYAPPNLEGKGNIYFTSESLPDITEEKTTTDEDKLIRSFKRQTGKESRIDLVSIDSAVHTIYLIEVKRGGLDDRTVGQLLRYYEHWSLLLYRNDCRMLNLNYIKLLLVVDSVTHESWKSLPQFFRDIVDIYIYKIDTDGVSLLLVNARKQLLSPG